MDENLLKVIEALKHPHVRGYLRAVGSFLLPKSNIRLDVDGFEEFRITDVGSGYRRISPKKAAKFLGRYKWETTHYVPAEFINAVTDLHTAAEEYRKAVKAAKKAKSKALQAQPKGDSQGAPSDSGGDDMFGNGNEFFKLMMMQQMLSGATGAGTDNPMTGLFGGLVGGGGGMQAMLQNELKMGFGKHLAKVLDNSPADTQVSVGVESLVKLANGKWQPMGGGDEVTSLNLVLSATTSGQQINFNMFGTNLLGGLFS